MISKHCLIATLGLLSSLTVFAQKQNVYYLKNDGTISIPAEKADFVRIISEPDPGSLFYNVKEYYPNDKLKLVGRCSNADSGALNLHGEYTRYYPTGLKKQTGNYERTELNGDIYDYYPNGKLYRIRRYNPFTQFSLTEVKPDIIACYDSLGKVLLTNGNGYYIDYSDDFQTIVEEGNLKSGLKDGVWKGGSNSGTAKYSYKASFENGKFISGEYIDNNGMAIKSTQAELQPTFKGGQNLFQKYLNRNLRYPSDAKTNHTEGRVFIKFIVNPDGSLSNFQILRDPGNGLGNEAIRVLKQSPNWIPGMQNGKPIAMEFTSGIDFSLQMFRL